MIAVDTVFDIGYWAGDCFEYQDPFEWNEK